MAWRHASCSAPRGFRDISTPWRGWHFLATLAALQQALSRPKSKRASLAWINKAASSNSSVVMMKPAASYRR